jgi:pimeloyl-ACP methyl ester carboxylesterase
MLDTSAAETIVHGPVGQLAVIDHGGDGPDVLLLHGATRTLLDWELMRPYLPGMRLVAMDLRGHGRSTPPANNDYDWDGHLADVQAVIDAVGLHRPFVVGHSLGGSIAVCYAAEHPHCPGIVDLDGFGFPDHLNGLTPDEVARRLADMVAASVKRLGHEIVTADEVEALVAHARAQMEMLGVDPDIEEAATRRALVPGHDGSYRRRPPPQSQVALVAPLKGWDVFAVMRDLTCPALVVRGKRWPTMDRLSPDSKEFVVALITAIDRELRQIQHDCAHVETVQLDATHMLHLEAAATVGRLVERFIRQSSRTRGGRY